ncbi:AAA domain-containing protein [Ensifer adhaerens]|uniref:AAA domain-containing protein n=1 Tax=Ensifer adhaerens TaxID=106592 RepID=UPI001C4E2C9F|nr:AAA domain-containing protein [Ensifer adhaerens]MBW0365854.1 AAA family ATPase [Ensifer adhaerens]UCM20241.1 AAA family ATPase [Ensifer adhaerens]
MYTVLRRDLDGQAGCSGRISMLPETVKRLLSLSVKGMSNAQILGRIRHAGLPVSPDEIMHSLVELQRNGEVILTDGRRWVLYRGTNDHTAAAASTLGRSGGAVVGNVLQSVTFTYFARQAEVQSPLEMPVTSKGALPAWSDLLGYYESTQRLDPRGQVEQFADRHGIQFQLIFCEGSWWQEGELTVHEDRLPAAFREALTKRGNETLALGYGTGVVTLQGVPTFMPALLLPAVAKFSSGSLSIELTSSQPVLNPKWLSHFAKRSAYATEDFKERLYANGEDSSLSEIANVMRNALATQIIGNLQPARLSSALHLDRTGISNTLAIYLPDDSSFTRATASNLSTLRGWVQDYRAPTALSHLLEYQHSGDTQQAVEVINPLPLTANQLEAANIALRSRLTAIQGPPGTGKSQVIVSLITSAILQNKSVLLASRNHQAVDEVERRLNALAEGRTVIVRTRDSEGERDVNFLQALREIAFGHAMPVAASNLANDLGSVEKAAMHRRKAFEKVAEHEAISLRLSQAIERLSAIQDELPGMQAPKIGWLRRLAFILKKLVLPSRNLGLEGYDYYGLRLAIDEDLRSLKSIELIPVPAGTEEEALSKEVARLLPAKLDSIMNVSEEERLQAAACVKSLDFDGVKSVDRIAEEEARLIVAKRPIWASTTLSVAKRIPMIPCLFDYVIFDEASQCDIASALPLMARARAAIIVGDPEQLTFIPTLSLHQENALMDAATIPKSSRPSIAQSINSLFAFVSSQPGCRSIMLRDQFRSAPEIVTYLNDVFYRGKLQAQRAEADLRAPSSYRPGLHWEDVPGHVRISADGGAVNTAEADAITHKVLELIGGGFQGSIGIVSPFNAQIGLLKAQIHAAIPKGDRQRTDIKIATVDSFQGGEADVVLFSVVVGPGAPQSQAVFLRRDKRRFNVAVSRARAVCIVFGDLAFARSSDIAHLRILAERATAPPRQASDLFESQWERIVDAALRQRGFDPLPQYPVGRRRLDFALFNKSKNIKLNLEIDGRRWHVDPDGMRKKSDLLRDLEMQGRGWKVRRFWVHELDTNLEACLDAVERDLEP